MSVQNQDYQIRYYHMHIDGLEGRFVVAKIRRVSSSPVLEGLVGTALASALGRLIDIFRLGTDSRNFADLKTIDGFLRASFGLTAEQEWDAYLREICRIQFIDHLDLISPSLLTPLLGQSDHPVVFHGAEMNERPYVVARVNSIMGSPAPTLLTFPNEKESALARLRDVFRVGKSGQVYLDFAEHGQKLGRSEREIMEEWKACEQAVAWETG